MHVMILGAGVVGTTSAWFLRQAGFEVTVVDRQTAAGMETSFANGGQISVGQAEPWANPEAPRKILRWLGREDAPLLFRLRADAAQWRWGLRFLAECRIGRSHLHAQQLVRLGLESRTQLGLLRQQLGLEYDQQTRGILAFFEDAKEFRAAANTVDWMTEQGCPRYTVSAQQAIDIEPALAPFLPKLVGGVYTEADESGDAHRFTQVLAQHCTAAGVRWQFDTEIKQIHYQHGRITSVSGLHGNCAQQWQADAYVVALGSYSPRLLRPIGLKLPIYPVKGYSITLPVGEDKNAPFISLTDEARKLVFSRLGGRLRVAGTAELNGYNMVLNPTRLKAIEQRTFELFPGLRNVSAITHWTGLRPATPNNIPLIGRTMFDNLYLNTGHGTLGWTMSCGSARLLTDVLLGERTGINSAR
ncbi:D-amino acid dehydrogenase [Chitinivorax sp. B]|uniref:D-amino acid dehydrogenase n=1 Tax=Chitinivorax sp. B TaxID=2502235 RepID=UPI0010F9F1E0|nr:D-amino acid dehydrogenase [Chitinivorax sp. B]